MNLTEYHNLSVDETLMDLNETNGTKTLSFIIFSSMSDPQNRRNVCRFPETSDADFNRMEQYEMMTSLFSTLTISLCSLSAYMKIQVPSVPSVPEGFWEKEMNAVLVGTINQSSHIHTIQQYETTLILFGEIDGHFLTHRIDEMNDWQQLVGNSTPFRDFLFTASPSLKQKRIYRWNDLFNVAKSMGFDFDFYDTDAKMIFMRDQTVFVS